MLGDCWSSILPSLGESRKASLGRWSLRQDQKHHLNLPKGKQMEGRRQAVFQAEGTTGAKSQNDKSMAVTGAARSLSERSI